MTSKAWQFWIDRGGTFTDIVARPPVGPLITHKLLSVNPQAYPDAAFQGIQDVLERAQALEAPIEVVKMGTTVGTNALLERKGPRTAFVTTAGFGDALAIGTQARPDLFALHIEPRETLYSSVLEIDERVGAQGAVLQPLDESQCRERLTRLLEEGIESLAIGLLHSYRYPAHEEQLLQIAREVGFTQVSVSSEVCPLIKWLHRCNTTVVDAFLSPILAEYVERLRGQLGTTPTLFMQSGGGLVDAQNFRGKDCLLSGPAGGVIGMIHTATAAGFDRLIGFDMGGTSTDVCHYAGTLERTRQGEANGLPVMAPMVQVHTVAAGGGSILHFDGLRMRVGPDSAGADPGPACYGNGGPLTVTDCNVVLGILQPDFFPSVMGPERNLPLQDQASAKAFTDLQSSIDTSKSIETIAEGFLTIAVDNMANAIKRISVQRGYDVTQYALVCFGGAGGQHACRVAEQLGMRSVVVHPHAGVLSALGMGLAELRDLRSQSLECDFAQLDASELERSFEDLQAQGQAKLNQPGLRFERSWRLRYAGSDSGLDLPFTAQQDGRDQFESAHRERFGFTFPSRDLIVESVTVESIAHSETHEIESAPTGGNGEPLGYKPVFAQGTRRPVPFFQRENLRSGQAIPGPAVVIETTGTTWVAPGWNAEMRPSGDLVLTLQVFAQTALATDDTKSVPDPIQLELYNNRFMNIAEQMGAVLQNTAASVNIKERLDFSCALFNAAGELVANAPHIPVHLGSMGAAVRAVIEDHQGEDALRPGDLIATNAPYNGGTHLPDITVVKPVCVEGLATPTFFVACRGHHADIGGRVPGSAPADSVHIHEEGIQFDNFLLVRDGQLQTQALHEHLTSSPYPARNPAQNTADLQAQIAACETGARELTNLAQQQTLPKVQAYMGHVLDYAEACVRSKLAHLADGTFETRSDDGHRIRVAVRVDRSTRTATIDFDGSSEPHPGNFNAPPAIARAAVMYVFRCLIDEDIPINAGCLRPLEIRLPQPSWLAPRFPSAVFAGNVETSQLIVEALLGALQIAGASQGTMNNFLWGNDHHQYYETIGGGAGATHDGPGMSAVQTHMTNSRITDTEVLEWRFPVVVEAFAYRRESGGLGLHKGGDGALRRVRFLEAMHVNLVSNHRIESPYGMLGGQPGKPGINRHLPASGETIELPGVAQVEVLPGGCIEIQTPGGGGFGECRRT